MKKIVALLLVVVMVFSLFGCGSSKKSAEQTVFKDYRRTLLRPESFILRSAYSFSGYLYEDEPADYIKELRGDFIFFTYTCENASGKVTECYALYDKGSQKFYEQEEITESKVRNVPMKDHPVECFVSDMLGYLGMANKYIEVSTKQVESWFSEGKLEKLDVETIDSINEALKN